MEPPLTKIQLMLIDHYSNTRFDCEFWGCVNMRRVIRQLLKHIEWLEKKKMKPRMDANGHE
ncbi:MAG: hypothetical protein JRC60_05675 [Deltaproteobacteria bacterium]|nr:hypothetical protein [Deltaproteobacteria bacterium]